VPDTVCKSGEEECGLGKYNGGSELAQSTLYAFLKLSQWKPLILKNKYKTQVKRNKLL
jgi:hypothetical protein